MTNSSGHATPSRRWWLYLAMILLVPITIELVSLSVYRVVLGRGFSYREVRAAQDDARRRPQPGPEPLAGEANRPQQFLREDVLHPYVGFVGNPQLDPGFSDWGFWGKLGSPPPRRSPGRVLIGIFGGSLAADFDEYGGARLKERLQHAGMWAGREIVLLNTAYGGYKQPQPLMALTYVLALGAELDVVVNHDGFNDVALDAVENAPQGVFPAYPRGWALRVESFRDPALIERVGAIAVLRDRRAALAEGFEAPPWRFTVTAGLMWTLLDRRAASQIADARRELNAFKPADRRYQAAGPARPSTETAVYEELTDLWQRGSLQLQRLCQANGIRYFHFLQPNQYVEGSKPMGSEERRVAVDASHPYRHGVLLGYPLLRRKGQALAEQGVAFRDLTLLFGNVEEPLYVDNCCHLNRRGYELLADAVAATILETRQP